MVSFDSQIYFSCMYLHRKQLHGEHAKLDTERGELYVEKALYCSSDCAFLKKQGIKKYEETCLHRVELSSCGNFHQ